MNHTSITRRNTTQKQIILQVLKDLGGHATAVEIVKALPDTSPVSRATVYRVLSDMADDGIIMHFTAGNEERFDITNTVHRHVLCRNCGRVEDVSVKTDDEKQIISNVSDSSGFTVENAHVEYVGLCSVCREKNKKI